MLENNIKKQLVLTLLGILICTLIYLPTIYFFPSISDYDILKQYFISIFSIKDTSIYYLFSYLVLLIIFFIFIILLLKREKEVTEEKEITNSSNEIVNTQEEIKIQPINLINGNNPIEKMISSIFSIAKEVSDDIVKGDSNFNIGDLVTKVSQETGINLDNDGKKEVTENFEHLTNTLGLGELLKPRRGRIVIDEEIVSEEKEAKNNNL